ncbi:MAG: mechanosensitive ion channel family protein [Pirellulaceae bacterium]|nr:mechanosensitive ion channel family protein [Pirellulaceae bacterium]
MKWKLLLFAISVAFSASEMTVLGQESNAKDDVKQEIEKSVQDLGSQASTTLESLQSGDFQSAVSGVGVLLKGYALPAATAFVVFILAYFFAAFVARICSAPVRKRVDETLGRFVGKVIFYLIIVGAGLGVLQYFGIGVTSFAAVIGAAGFAVGLAFQGTLSNFSAGVMLLVFRPFKVGDVINAAGITAKVNEIDLFATTFDTPDNRRIVVPNSMISGGIIENVTHHNERRIDVNVGVDYSAEIDTTRAILLAAVQSLDGIIEGEGRGIQIYLNELADSSVNWVVRVWFPAAAYSGKREELMRAIKMHLDEAGIGIPFPQMDVHVSQEKS